MRTGHEIEIQNRIRCCATLCLKTMWKRTNQNEWIRRAQYKTAGEAIFWATLVLKKKKKKKKALRSLPRSISVWLYPNRGDRHRTSNRFNQLRISSYEVSRSLSSMPHDCCGFTNTCLCNKRERTQNSECFIVEDHLTHYNTPERERERERDERDERERERERWTGQQPLSL